MANMKQLFRLFLPLLLTSCVFVACNNDDDAMCGEMFHILLVFFMVVA